MSIDGSSGSTYTSFIILPPPNILDSFLRTYSSRFESYYRLTGPTVNPNELMQHGNGKLSTILILLMIGFGATAIPTLGTRHITGGLTEVCRLALFQINESDLELSSDPMMAHCALLYLTLGIWSGEKWHMDVSLFYQ